MKYRLNADTDVYLNGNRQLEIQKGIWNREEVLIELNTDDLKNESMKMFLRMLEEREEIEEDSISEDITKQLFTYLVENGFLQKEDEKKNIADILAKKKILLVVSDEFKEIKKNILYGDIETKNFEDILKDIGADKLTNLDVMDAYEHEILCRKAKEYFIDYIEVSFLLKNPNIEELKLIARILNDIEKVTSYAIIDNGLLFSFTCIPYETACFNCFDLRITARNGMSLKKRFYRKKGEMHNKIQLFTYKNNVELCFIFDLVIKILADGRTYKTRCNVGRVIILNLNTLELTSEQLYKVPFCEGC